MSKPKVTAPKLPMWVKVFIGSGIILGIGQLFYHYSTDDNDLTEFGLICRLIGGTIFVIGIFTKIWPSIRPRKFRM